MALFYFIAGDTCPEWQRIRAKSFFHRNGQKLYLHDNINPMAIYFTDPSHDTDVLHVLKCDVNYGAIERMVTTHPSFHPVDLSSSFERIERMKGEITEWMRILGEDKLQKILDLLQTFK